MKICQKAHTMIFLGELNRSMQALEKALLFRLKEDLEYPQY